MPTRAVRSRHGNALMVVLAIAVLLGIQLYIVMVYSSSSFRHVEKVNAHVRAIYVGESAFGRIVARLKAGRWEDRWFKAGAVTETNVPLMGGTYSSYIATAREIPDKFVDVWLEGHYGTAIAPMYYRILFRDDSLDFTAQVYPAFFTFLQSTDPTPINGSVGPAIALIQSQIIRQHDNQPQALASLKSIQNTMDAAGVGSTLGFNFPGAPLDVEEPFGQAPLAQPPYLVGLKTNANGYPPPPPVPTPSSDLAPPRDFLLNFRSCFNSVTGLQLPLGPFTGDPAPYAPYFKDAAALNTFVTQWTRIWNHQPTVFSHYTKVGQRWNSAAELPTILRLLAERYEANPLSPVAPNILQLLLCAIRDLVPTASDLLGVVPPAVSLNMIDPLLGGVLNSANLGAVFTGYRDWWHDIKGI